MGFSKQEFSEDTIARIAAAVRDYENRKGGGVSHRRPAIDRPPMDDFIYGVLDADLLAGSSATMSIHDASGDTGANLTVYDNILQSGQQMPSTSFIHVKWHWGDDRHYLIGSKDCSEAQ